MRCSFTLLAALASSGCFIDIDEVRNPTAGVGGVGGEAGGGGAEPCGPEEQMCPTGTACEDGRCRITVPSFCQSAILLEADGHYAWDGCGRPMETGDPMCPQTDAWLPIRVGQSQLGHGFLVQLSEHLSYAGSPCGGEGAGCTGSHDYAAGPVIPMPDDSKTVLVPNEACPATLLLIDLCEADDTGSSCDP